MDSAAACGYILGQMCSTAGGTSQTEAPLRLSESGSRGLPGYGHWFITSHPVAAAHKETAANCPPKERRRYSLRRNSFIEMAKLHNLSGRITYISSHAKQEYLYEVYATEPGRAFWRELAKCNQEEFEKSGTNGKCIEARELMIALPESFISYDHDYLLKKMVDKFKEKYGV